ncbi:UTRA domain-containing protein [Herbidospora sp. NEAU-GS84]|uniref:UTRA domain-containing protein n=1 Tax=Herbidospora solisilvae TaxID=2696284 RepID=A0A7C9K2W4_9ACTN|nr:GntR family transcriptional regulator [Herbidospora solisilvae]NAS27519.1 UTRA domain-containing protein [Herbidospora solisilvae]
MSPRSSYVPAYVEIADDIRHKISTGVLVGGDKIPSERELCEQWSVSSITARKAIESLRSEGLVYGLRGRGTFVRKHQPLRRIAPQRYWRPHSKATYKHEAESAGRSVSVEHSSSPVEASAEVAERLAVSSGAPVMEIRYLIRMDDQPVSSSVCWEPLGITGGTEIEDPHSGPHAGAGIVPRFDAIGYRVDRVKEVLTIRMPDPEEVAALDIPPGVPVVQIQQTFTADGVPVETADIVFPADRYTLEYDMEIR